MKDIKTKSTGDVYLWLGIKIFFARGWRSSIRLTNWPGKSELESSSGWKFLRRRRAKQWVLGNSHDRDIFFSCHSWMLSLCDVLSFVLNWIQQFRSFPPTWEAKRAHEEGALERWRWLGLWRWRRPGWQQKWSGNYLSRGERCRWTRRSYCGKYRGRDCINCGNLFKLVSFKNFEKKCFCRVFELIFIQFL